MADIVVVGGGMSAGHAVEDCVKSRLKVTACMSNPFMEFPMGATVFLNKPDEHKSFMCGNPESWKHKGADYIFEPVMAVDPDAKVVKLASGTQITYKALIVATGSKLPLFSAKAGDNLEQRMAEVKNAGTALSKAKTVIINGSGLVGLEMAGDIRAKQGPHVRIIVLSRDGRVCANSHPDDWQKRILLALGKMNIEVMKGSVKSVSNGDPMMPHLESGVANLSGGEGNANELAYDVYIPSFMQGPNTDLLAGSEALNDKKQIIVNECLQSTVYPEIFGVGVTTEPALKHPISSRVTAQARTCAKNAILVVSGRPPVPHKDKEQPPPLDLPMNVKIGHGPGAYVLWDTAGFPCPVKVCCCLPCGGGFPCCPPPCCWCCAPGCARACGDCCGQAEGEGSARFMNCLVHKFLDPHGYKGPGLVPPEMQQMKS